MYVACAIRVIRCIMIVVVHDHVLVVSLIVGALVPGLLLGGSMLAAMGAYRPLGLGMLKLGALLLP